MARDSTALAKLGSVLSTLEASSEFTGTGPREPESLVAAFRLVASVSRFSVSAPRTDAVQVMGMVEALGFENDFVFVGGLSEKDIPRKELVGALLPDNPGLRVEMVDWERSLVLQRYRFLMAVTSARKHLYLSRPATLGEKEVISSIFLDELCRRFEVEEPEPPAAPAPRTLRDLLVTAGDKLGDQDADPREHLLKLPRALRQRVVHAVDVELMERSGGDSPYAGQLSDEKLREEVASRYRERAFSATEIETYNRCPFSFMAGYIVGLKEEEEPSAHVTRLTLGNVIHEALFEFLSIMRDRGGLPMESDKRDECLKLLAKCVQRATDRHGGESLSWELLPGMLVAPGGALERWLDTELEDEELRPFTGYVPRFMELAFGVTRGERDPASIEEPVTVTIDGRDILFKGKIDRVDVGDDGQFLLYDYKSSTSKGAQPEDIKAGHRIQLVLYPQVLASAAEWGLACPPGKGAASSAFYRVSPHTSVMRRFLCSRLELPRARKNVSSYNKRDDTGRIMFYQEPLEDIQSVVNKTIITAIDGIEESRFQPAEKPSSYCRYCPARNACRSPEAKVAGEW